MKKNSHRLSKGQVVLPGIILVLLAMLTIATILQRGKNSSPVTEDAPLTGKVVYTGHSEGQFQLESYDVGTETGTSARLPEPGLMETRYAASNGYLFTYSEQDHAIEKFDADGKTVAKVVLKGIPKNYNYIYFAAASPDSNKLFVSIQYEIRPYPPIIKSKILIVNFVDSTFKEIPLSEDYLQDAFWSPDSRYVAVNDALIDTDSFRISKLPDKEDQVFYFDKDESRFIAAVVPEQVKTTIILKLYDYSDPSRIKEIKRWNADNAYGMGFGTYQIKAAETEKKGEYIVQIPYENSRRSSSEHLKKITVESEGMTDMDSQGWYSYQLAGYLPKHRKILAIASKMDSAQRFQGRHLILIDPDSKEAKTIYSSGDSKQLQFVNDTIISKNEDYILYTMANPDPTKGKYSLAFYSLKNDMTVKTTDLKLDIPIEYFFNLDWLE